MLQATNSALTAEILEYQTERDRDGTRCWQCRGCLYGRVRMKQRPPYVRGESAGLWGLAWENWGPADLPTQCSCFCLLLLPAPQVCSIHIQQRCVWERERKREILREPNLLYASALQHLPYATAHVDKKTVDHIYKTQKHTHTGEDILGIITERRTQKSSHLCHAGSCPPLSQHLAGGRLNNTNSCAT